MTDALHLAHTAEAGTRELEILLVEDNPGDVRLVEEGFATEKVDANLHVAEDGEDALALIQQSDDAEAPRPDLVLLDLNLPGLSGHDLLGQLKDDPELKEIPVVVLTTSESREDREESYRLQAAGFVTKPVDVRDFVGTIRDLGLYWGGVVQLPPK